MTKKHQFKPIDPQVNFPEMEKKLLKWWYESGVINKYLNKNKDSKKTFSFIDGPITANNPMGVHHAWGRSFKDLWQKYHNMKGEAGRFQNGFDCQGLWVEVEVEKELGIRNKRDIENLVPNDKKASIAKFVELCKARVRKYSAIQTEQSKRLGYFMNWENSYFTMSDENNYMIWHFLKTCFEKGWIYKGRESVPWCPRCETAISQHEMLTEDYKEIVHDSVYFELPIVGRDHEFLLVWTTTPWTLPGNIAVAVDSNMEYSLVKGDTDLKFWVAKDLVKNVFGNKSKEIVKTVKGKELVGLKYRGPFDNIPKIRKIQKENPDNFHSVIPTDSFIMPISNTEGTGMVHTAVSAGIEDFKLGKKLKLPMVTLINDDASYMPDMDWLAGQNAKKHPEIILDFIKKVDSESGTDWVFKIEKYKHRYPACWRCKAELVWKVADEWYIAMDKIDSFDKKKRTLRIQMMDTAKEIKWMPEFGLERELDWLKNMHDWLISKPNRYWGLALPIYECAKCGNFEVIGGKAELQKKAVSGWEKFENHSPHKPWIDDVKIKCAKCGEVVSRLPDVGNVWLDAGIIAYSTFVDPATQKVSYTDNKEYWKKWFPADFITESFPGQFKNWFYSMIAMSTVLERTTPFKSVLGYGTLLGEDGRPMHKSWGNSIEFNEGADKIGVDVMRWMFASHDPSQNMLFGYKKADETRRRFQLLLWNIYNFFVTYAIVDKFENQNKKPELDNVLDKWILSGLNETLQITTESLDKYDVFTYATSIEKFVADLSLWYVRRSRDRIGPGVELTHDKHLCYRTLFIVLKTLVKMMAPVMPFMSDEIYKNLTGEESVHLADWPIFDSNLIDQKLDEKMVIVRKIAELGHAERKAVGIKVRQPLSELKVKTTQILEPMLLDILKSELNVKKIIQEKGEVVETKLFTEISPELALEGEARELIRKIQIMRKEKKCRIEDRVKISLPKEYQKLPENLIKFVQKEALLKEIVWADILNLLI